MKNNSSLPTDWDEKRMQEVLAHYENQNDEEAVSEDEAAFHNTEEVVMNIPLQLVPAVRALVANYRKAA